MADTDKIGRTESFQLYQATGIAEGDWRATSITKGEAKLILDTRNGGSDPDSALTTIRGYFPDFDWESFRFAPDAATSTPADPDAPGVAPVVDTTTSTPSTFHVGEQVKIVVPDDMDSPPSVPDDAVEPDGGWNGAVGVINAVSTIGEGSVNVTLTDANDGEFDVLLALHEVEKLEPDAPDLAARGLDPEIVVTLDKVEKVMDAMGDTKARERVDQLRSVLEQATVIDYVKPPTPGNTSDSYIVHPLFNRIFALCSAGLKPMLIGPAGCGKSRMVEELTRAFGFDPEDDLFTQSMTGGLTYSSFFASKDILEDGSTEWTYGPFLQAIQHPGVVFLDEVNRADPDILVGLNPVLEPATARFDGPAGTIRVHPDCIIIGADNADGRQISQQYGTAQIQDGAVLNRFIPVRMDYDTDAEKQILRSIGIPNKPAADWVARMTKIRNTMRARQIDLDVGTRTLLQIADLVTKCGRTIEEAMEDVVFSRLSASERTLVDKG